MWFDAIGLDRRFQVTRCGMIKSVDRHVDNYPKGKRLIKGRVLKCSIDKAGYKRVDTRNRIKGTGSYELLHRVIAKTFIENPLELPCVNHIDGNKLNNNVSNLEWCDQSYNSLHAWRTGLCDSTKTPVMCSADGVGVWYPYMRKALEDGCNPSLIHAAINGRQRTHKGFSWVYCDTNT